MTVDVVIADSLVLLAIWLGIGIAGAVVQWMTTPRDEAPGAAPVV